MFSGAYSEERVQGSQPSDQPEMHTLGRESGCSRGRPKEAVGLLGRQTSQPPPPGTWQSLLAAQNPADASFGVSVQQQVCQR